MGVGVWWACGISYHTAKWINSHIYELMWHVSVTAILCSQLLLIGPVVREWKGSSWLYLLQTLCAFVVRLLAIHLLPYIG